MDRILQGTTPTLVIELNKEDVLLDSIDQIELVFHQVGQAFTVKTKDDCVLNAEDNTVSYRFTEEETLAMKPGKPLFYQMRMKTDAGTILGTEKAEIDILNLMRDAVMDQ